MKKTETIKRNKLGAIVMTILIAAYVAPLCMVCAGAEEFSGTGKIPSVPGVPDNAVQYNKTDMTPVSEMEQVKAGEPALFCYRNMTMLMNCSQNCEIVVTVDPEVTPKILGLSVDSNQPMALTMNMYSSPLQGEMVTERTLNFYLGIEPNATLQLSAQIRLHINQTQLNQELNRVVNASRLTWMYLDRSRLEWVPVESHMDQNGYLVCNTNHFSTWTVAEITPTEDPTSYGWITYAIIGAIVAAVSIVTVAAIVRRRKK